VQEELKRCLAAANKRAATPQYVKTTLPLRVALQNINFANNGDP